MLVGESLGRQRLDEADRVVRARHAARGRLHDGVRDRVRVRGAAIGRAFTPDPDVARVVVRLLHVAAVFQTLDAVTTVFRGALRGAKDVRVVMFIGTAVVWTCVPGAAYWLGARAGLGAVGGWYGFIAETTVSAVLFAWRWRVGAWRAAYEPRSRIEAQVAMA